MPLYGQEVEIRAHELAQPDKGTGIAMICTFGDTTDVTWWRELNLDMRAIIGRDGRILPDAPLGVDAVARRALHVDRLDTGDMLVLYTDGLVERRDELIDVGIERLRSAIARAPAESAGALCTAILEEVGTEQPDDIALLGVKG